jgi:hypothetical protein
MLALTRNAPPKPTTTMFTGRFGVPSRPPPPEIVRVYLRHVTRPPVGVERFEVVSFRGGRPELYRLQLGSPPSFVGFVEDLLSNAGNGLMERAMRELDSARMSARLDHTSQFQGSCQGQRGRRAGS